jgi:hypothetical protein
MQWTKKRINNLLFIVGVIFVVGMIFSFDVSFPELWQHILDAGKWMIPIVGVWFFVYGINALSWRQIIRGNCKDAHKVSFLRIFRLTITGYALNYATPVGGLGGEPYRILELSRDVNKQEATSSVILYAMMHIFAHFWLWFTSIFLWLGLVAYGDPDVKLNTLYGILLAVAFVFCLIAFYLFSRGYKNGLVIKTLRLIGKIPGLKGWSQRFLEKHSEALHNVDRQIAALHQQDKKAFYSSFLLEYLSRIVQSLEIMFMLLSIGENCGGGIEGYTLLFLHSILILAFTSLFANLIGFLPLQLGVQEGGFMLSIAALGLSAATGLFVSIICRVREIIWIAIGLLLMKLK